jgi:hypothetical protein
MTTTLTPAQIERNRKGGFALNRPDQLAMRLARLWPTADPDEKERALDLIRPLVMPDSQREALFAILAPRAVIGAGKCDRCHGDVASLFHTKDLDEVCAACLSGVGR